MVSFKQKIQYAMRRTPHFRGYYRYIPLHQLPSGTEVVFDAQRGFEEFPRRLINGYEEENVVFLPEKRFVIRILNWPSVTFKPYNGVIEVKPLYSFLSATSVFTANFDQEQVTYRLTTGKIKKIFIPGTKFKCHEEF